MQDSVDAMTAKKFPSKIDAWLVVLMVVAVGGVVFAFFSVVFAAEDTRLVLVVLASMLLVVLLVGSTLLRTHYTIDGNSLRIVSGPFHWTVPIDQIDSVVETRNPLSSPALSMDRLRIRYSGRRSVMISPRDKKKFLKALGVGLDA